MSKIASRLIAEVAACHARLIEVIERLNDADFRAVAGPTAPSILFHVWHVARWNDLDQARLSDGPQRWIAEGLGPAWGLGDIALGDDDSGTGMRSDGVARLAPSAPDLIAYATGAFAAFESALGTLPPDSPAFMDAALTALVHDNRHLGMIEALIGAAGRAGSATN